MYYGQTHDNRVGPNPNVYMGLAPIEITIRPKLGLIVMATCYDRNTQPCPSKRFARMGVGGVGGEMKMIHQVVTVIHGMAPVWVVKCFGCGRTRVTSVLVTGVRVVLDCVHCDREVP